MANSQVPSSSRLFEKNHVDIGCRLARFHKGALTFFSLEHFRELATSPMTQRWSKNFGIFPCGHQPKPLNSSLSLRGGSLDGNRFQVSREGTLQSYFPIFPSPDWKKSLQNENRLLAQLTEDDLHLDALIFPYTHHYDLHQSRQKRAIIALKTHMNQRRKKKPRQL